MANNTIAEKLDDCIEQHLDAMANLNVGSDEMGAAINDLVKLYKFRIEEGKLDFSYDDKNDRRELDMQRVENDKSLKEQQLKLDEKKYELDKSEMMDYYNNRVKEEGYMDYSTNNKKVSDAASAEAKKPYVITPEDFGTRDDYACISLTYYADKVVTDEENDPLENVDDYISYDALNHFGEYEDDSVFVRNEERKTDYEILLDNRNYSDVAKTKPKK